MKVIAYQADATSAASTPLQEIEMDTPTASGHDLLVEVKAISVNPVDYKVWMQSRPEVGEWKILGWDAVGVVKAVGEEVTLHEVGHEVWYAGDLTRAGSHQQFQLVDERIVGMKPRSISVAEAAALPLTSICAWELIFDRLRIPTKIPKTVLVVGAAGGVGSILVQLLKVLTNTTIVATASRDQGVSWIKGLGAHHVIDHNQPLVEQFRALGIEYADYVVSLNRTEEHFAEICELVAPEGAVGVIDDPTTLDVMPLKQKSASLRWEFMFTRSMYSLESMGKQRELLNCVAELIDDRKLSSTLTHHLGKISADNLNQAFAMLSKHNSHGKIVLEDFAI